MFFSKKKTDTNRSLSDVFFSCKTNIYLENYTQQYSGYHI